jgi:hypothetical protein
MPANSPKITSASPTVETQGKWHRIACFSFFDMNGAQLFSILHFAQETTKTTNFQTRLARITNKNKTEDLNVMNSL